MKALNEDCVRFELFPPGHLYSSAAGGFCRWYNPHWFLEQVPDTPYQPRVLREAFEKVRACIAGRVMEMATVPDSDLCSVLPRRSSRGS